MNQRLAGTKRTSASPASKEDNSYFFIKYDFSFPAIPGELVRSAAGGGSHVTRGARTAPFPWPPPPALRRPPRPPAVLQLPAAAGARAVRGPAAGAAFPLRPAAAAASPVCRRRRAAGPGGIGALRGTAGRAASAETLPPAGTAPSERVSGAVLITNPRGFQKSFNFCACLRFKLQQNYIFPLCGKMAKRIAEKELTDRNWDQEDEAEEVGTFSVASEEVLKNRAIKKAKRRNVGSESESGGAFKGFKGFVLPSGKGGGGFSGFGNSAGIKPLEGLSNGSSSVSSTPPFSSLKSTSETQSAFGAPVSNGPSAAVFAEKKAVSPTANGGSQPCSSGAARGSGSYHRQLAALNCSVRDWIVKHVNSNPLCDLSPIFRDYERYLASIEQQHGSSTDSSPENESGKTPGPQAAPVFGSSKLQQGSTFLFNNKTEDAPDKKTEASSEKRDPLLGATSAVSFNFGKSVDSSVLCSIGSGTLSSFSFSPGNSGLFGKDANQAKSVTAASTSLSEAQTDSGNSDDKGGEEEEEEPPKVIVNEIKEDDAFYSKKCKLFYKKDNEFKEKGVGTLHLKPAGNEKTQLLVRADTNLGNILLNVLIPPKMPCTRTGKNNVLIVCVPNPPIDEKNPAVPVTMLIRVKTSEDADELHKILLEKKEA